MGLITKLRQIFLRDASNSSRPIPIFRFNGIVWYDANAGVFDKKLEYQTVLDAAQAHPQAVFINPLTLEPDTAGEISRLGF